MCKSSAPCIIFLLIVLLSSCSKGKEISRIVLTAHDKSLLPYTLGDSVIFQHSGGFVFPLTVTRKDISLEKTESDDGGDYTSFEVLTVLLQSTTPDFSLRFRILPLEMNYLNSFSLNRQDFYFPHAFSPQWDTLPINGQIYHDVYLLTNDDMSSQEVLADSIFFNSSHGILQISMNNDETYRLLP